MGCNTSKSNKGVLTSSEVDGSSLLQNGNEKIQNHIRETANDIPALDFHKAQQDLQQVGEGLTVAVNEGMNELLVGNGTVTHKSEDDDCGKAEEEEEERQRSLLPKMHSIEAVVENVEVGTEEPEIVNNTPIQPLDKVNENETEMEDSLLTPMPTSEETTMEMPIQPEM